MCYSTLRWRTTFNKMFNWWTPMWSFLTRFNQVKIRIFSVVNAMEFPYLCNNQACMSYCAYVIIGTGQKKTLRQHSDVPIVTDAGVVSPIFFTCHVTLNMCCVVLLCAHANITVRKLRVTFDHYRIEHVNMSTQWRRQLFCRSNLGMFSIR